MSVVNPYIERIDEIEYGYGDYGVFGIKNAFKKIGHGVKKVVTSKPFKVAAGVGAVVVGAHYLAPAVIGGGASAGAGAVTSGAVATAGKVGGLVSAGVNVAKKLGKTAVNVAKTPVAQQVALTGAQMYMSQKLAQEQLKQEMELAERQAELQRQQELQQMRELQMLQQTSPMPVATQYGPPMRPPTRGYIPPSPVQKSNDKLLLYGGMGLAGLALLLALNR